MLGSLLYVSKCVKHARFFLNRILQTLCSNLHEKIIKLDSEFTKDLNWFNKFLITFNSVTIFDKKPIDHQVHLDASLTGLGGIWHIQIYAITLPKNYHTTNIATLEMLNILVALKIWATKWTHKKIHFFCDNIAVVQVLKFGKTKDLELAALSRNILMLASSSDIHISVSHISGKATVVADLLSRWDTSSNTQEKLKKNYFTTSMGGCTIQRT